MNREFRITSPRVLITLQVCLMRLSIAFVVKCARRHSMGYARAGAIRTGIYGYPLEAATDIAVRTVREFAAEAGSLASVHFACFSEEVLRAYTGLGVEEAASLGEQS